MARDNCAATSTKLPLQEYHYSAQQQDDCTLASLLASCSHAAAPAGDVTCAWQHNWGERWRIRVPVQQGVSCWLNRPARVATAATVETSSTDICYDGKAVVTAAATTLSYKACLTLSFYPHPVKQ
jgi:hypothetical protein